MNKIYDTQELRSTLENLGYKLISSSDWWRTKPLYRDSNNVNSLSIHKRTGFFQDFGAEFRGSFEDLVKLTTGQSEIKLDLNFSEQEEKFDTNTYFPNDILDILIPDFTLYQNKRITFGTLMRFKSGLAQSWKLKNRIVFPIFDKKMRIIGLSGRWYKEKTPNENVPKVKLLGRKNNFIYPWHLSEQSIKDKREIIIVESIGDCLSLFECGIENVLVIFGCKLSSKQLSYIVGCDPKKIIIALNNDAGKPNEAGQKGSLEIRNKLTRLFSPSRIEIRLPDLENDLSDVLKNHGKSKILEWYNK